MARRSLTLFGFAVLSAMAAVAAAADTVMVIVRHEVPDYAAWRKGFDAGSAFRANAGLTGRYVFRDSDNPNFVTVMMQAQDLDVAKKFVSDPALKQRMQKANIHAADITIGVSGDGDLSK